MCQVNFPALRIGTKAKSEAKSGSDGSSSAPKAKSGALHFGASLLWRFRCNASICKQRERRKENDSRSETEVQCMLISVKCDWANQRAKRSETFQSGHSLSPAIVRQAFPFQLSDGSNLINCVSLVMSGAMRKATFAIRFDLFSTSSHGDGGQICLLRMHL